VFEKKPDADAQGSAHPAAGIHASAHFRLVFPPSAATLGDPRRNGMADFHAAAPYTAISHSFDFGAGNRHTDEVEREGRR
jgi:hypothetical protein